MEIGDGCKKIVVDTGEWQDSSLVAAHNYFQAERSGRLYEGSGGGLPAFGFWQTDWGSHLESVESVTVREAVSATETGSVSECTAVDG